MKPVLGRSSLLLTLLLAGCSLLASISPDTTETASLSMPTTPPPVASIAPVETASATEPCAYMWAAKSLPQVSDVVNQSIQKLQAEATGQARAYGENCVYADGHADFSAMETDFYISFHVKDLKNEGDLGDQITRIMQVVNALPPDSLAGPQPGFVEITFKAGDDQRVLRVDIRKFRSLPPGLSGTELMKALFPSP